MWRLVAIGVGVHLLLLSAVFDVYFFSTIQKGMPSHKANGEAPAKRLVLFVADGLRAASIYGDQMKERAPYLNRITNEMGSWGVCHTQVPTESRPGHVAILAGFNEDPSAITRGWKSNPVDFDSVINQSANAFCWGSPDIVDLFNRDNLSHIHLHSYDSQMQDFSGVSPVLLDKWVFDRVKNFVQKNKEEPCSTFCDNGNIYFLHLLGLDTAGHAFKPHSDEYIYNIAFVDEEVYRIETMIEGFFGDKKTAYIFTADHGMTNWGSHGDGSEHETEVPFIAWGAGIAVNQTRQDIEQASVAPLISSLLGINIPVNSMGVVPINYLRTSVEQTAQIIFANARQLSEQYTTKQFNVKGSNYLLTFQPFTKLSEDALSEKLLQLQQFMERGRYRQVIYLSYKLIHLCKEGIKYYDNYYQEILLSIVTIGFVGWIIYLFTSIKDLGTTVYNYCKSDVIQHKTKLWSSESLYVSSGMILVSTTLLYLSLPFMFFLYSLFPIFIWAVIGQNREQIVITFKFITMFTFKELVYAIVTYLIGIELLVQTFFQPRYLAFLYLLFAYQAFTVKPTIRSYYWISGHLLGIFPTMLKLQTTFSFLKELPTCILWICYCYRILRKETITKDKKVLLLQFFMLSVAFTNSWLVDVSVSDGRGLLVINQYVSWILLMLSPIMPLFMSLRVENRIVSAVIALLTPYTLMSVGYESLYMFFFAQHMINWLQMEYLIRKAKFQSVQVLSSYSTNVVLRQSAYLTDEDSVRRCFYLLSYIMLSYFGVGNTAAMNSFDPMWVRCFVTVFSPFTMASLILIKLMIPFLLIMCVFRGIMIITRAQIRNTFLIILLFCDFMVIRFFYHVKNEGSWLEIGVSLSRFITVNVTTIMLLLLYQFAYILTTARASRSTLVKFLPSHSNR